VSRRLQHRIDETELRTIERLARLGQLTTAEWVRRRLREAVGASVRPDSASKLEAIRAAHAIAPSGRAPEIDQMLEEIERGL
jgi:hypothetical protein